MSGSTPDAFNTADRCTVATISDAAELGALRTQWDELFADSPTAAPPLRWEWVHTWWNVYGQAYGDRGRGLRILTVRRGSKLIGILPLYRGKKDNGLLSPWRLCFVSTGASDFEETCTEYLNLLHAPGAEGLCLEALGPVISKPSKLGWDELILSDIPAGAALLALAPQIRGPFLRAMATSAGVCHLFSLEGGYEGYLKRISHENRRQARKMLRDFEAEGMRFEVADDAQRLHLFFDQMIELHRQRWAAVGKSGSFAPRHAEFHRKTAELLLARGEAVIARLSHGDRPLAVVFGYRGGDRLHCYQQGVAPGIGRLRSPGTAAWLLLMRHQAERGVTMFDHLRGTTQFKERFATDQDTVTELRVVRLGVRTAAAAALDLAGRAARRLVRKIRRPAEPGGLVQQPGQSHHYALTEESRSLPQVGRLQKGHSAILDLRGT
jgi:CelD/BcsL family acetyltransferase involved in cellulose biosynthesis